MAMITRRPRAQVPTIAGWDPFRMMRELMQIAPERELEGMGGDFVPEFEVKETDQGFVIRGDVPGVKQDDLDIDVSGNNLTVSGKREEESREENEKYYRYERSYGSFSRTFPMPESADLEHATADLSGGVLTVSMPKKTESKGRKISLSSQAKA